MIKLREEIFIWFIALVYLMGQMGCATGRYEYPKPEPLSETYRALLGTIGVASVPGLPDIHFDRPLPTSQPGVLVRMGEGAWEGGKKSGKWMVDVCSFKKPYAEERFVGTGVVIIGLAALWGACFVLSVPVAILGGIGGLFYGVVPSSADQPVTTYTEYVEENEVHLRDSLAEYPIQENFQSSFLNEARARTSHMFVVVPEEGSQPSEGMVGQALDTVLELSVEKIWLQRLDGGEGEMNPPMVLVLFVRAKLMRAADKTVWYDQTFVHETDRHSYQVWAYYNRVQVAIEEAYQNLAEQLVEKLFLPNPTT
jgi:hypothetical protein